jgi:hypothetical protein
MTAIFVMSLLGISLGVNTGLSSLLFALTEAERYNSGYQHGCNDAKLINANTVGPDQLYLNGNNTEEHTDLFLQAYDEGYNECLVTTSEPKNGNYRFRVWVADVKPDIGRIQICADVNSTLASICKNLVITEQDIDFQIAESPITHSEILSFTPFEAPVNSSVNVCVYVFKSDTGDCDSGTVRSDNRIHDFLVFSNTSPVFYDYEDGRLYEYGKCYMNTQGSGEICPEDEGIGMPILD